MRAERNEEVPAFVAARRPALYRSAFLLVGNAPDAEDLVQATMVRVIASWDRIRRRDVPEVYARRVMVNLAASRWRRLRSYASLTRLTPPTGDEPDPSDAAVVRDAMWAAIQSLPVKMRAVVVLRYYEDLSEREIAAVLGCSAGTVKSQSSKALARLRVRLEPIDLSLVAKEREQPTPSSRSRP